MRGFQHRTFPEHSTLWAGRLTRDEASFQSDQRQIWYHHSDQRWVGDGEQPHLRLRSFECFVVLTGALIVEVDGERHRLGPREFCCFPAEQVHAILAVATPLETLVIRAPSTDDKVYSSHADRGDPWPPIRFRPAISST